MKKIIFEIIFIMLMLFVFYIFIFIMLNRAIDNVDLLLNNEYDCKIVFKQAEFLEKYQYSDVVRGKLQETKYDKFRLLDTGKEIKISFGRDGGHNGTPRAIIAMCDYYSKEGKKIENECDVSTDENFFIGRINGGLYNKRFYIYDHENNINLETNILESFNESSRYRFQNDVLDISVYQNKSHKDENGIAKFLTSEDIEYTLGNILYTKIKEYETEYGTMYILNKDITSQKSNDNESINRKTLGILKYGELDNQELIFDVDYEVLYKEYLYDGSQNIVNEFYTIVKEKESEI